MSPRSSPVKMGWRSKGILIELNGGSGPAVARLGGYVSSYAAPAEMTASCRNNRNQSEIGFAELYFLMKRDEAPELSTPPSFGAAAGWWRALTCRSQEPKTSPVSACPG